MDFYISSVVVANKLKKILFVFNSLAIAFAIHPAYFYDIKVIMKKQIEQLP